MKERRAAAMPPVIILLLVIRDNSIFCTPVGRQRIARAVCAGRRTSDRHSFFNIILLKIMFM